MPNREVISATKASKHFVDKEPAELKKPNIDPTRRYLYMQILGGKAFLEHMQESELLPGQVCSTFTLYLHFRNQRFRSKPVPCACEPDLQEGFLLEVQRDHLGDGNKMVDAITMLSIRDPVHMVLIKTDTSNERTLVASCFLDWQSVLSSPNGRTSSAVELLGVGSEAKVLVGILNLKLELLPQLNQTLTQEVVNAQDENGVNRPVCSYIRPLRAGRLLDTPRQAARFVSLLGYEKAPVVGGGGKQEQWCTLLSFLCQNKGDCEDHANLLCSLLLGFGLNAYVCVGTTAKSVPHTWVMACGTDGTITFWNSLTGDSCSDEPVRKSWPVPNDIKGLCAQISSPFFLSSTDLTGEAYRISTCCL
ncbi:centrosomal protein of 76 kDa-like isoform X3 [Acipenser ruthenus]|uniref:centrosomal protein of 76 kDa-like isoform X3 n=1 Tax=Acipenser ruthenus TaxID=7906 RepID=UPI002741245F|nr:centrosomal protein of 76 kDa-like isoform X3 [Acipenser ruthenus]